MPKYTAVGCKPPVHTTATHSFGTLFAYSRATQATSTTGAEAKISFPLRTSVARASSKYLPYQPFHRYNPNTARMETPKSYTEACEGHPMMYRHQGIVRHAVSSSHKDGTRAAPPGGLTYEAPLYDHPREIPPRELSHHHLNTMYCISNDDLRGYFPEGVGGRLAQLFVPGHPRGFLYRKQSHALRLYVEKVAQRKPEVARMLRGGRAGIVLDGPTGVGKSALLAQATHYARAHDVLTLYIPDAAVWSHGEYAWPSLTLPGFFDVPDASRPMLQYFARAHGSVLRQCVLQVTPRDLPLERGESPVRCLYDLCIWGCHGSAPGSIERQSIATKYLVDEIRAIRDRPVLIIVDGINLLAMDSHFRYPHPDFLRNITNFEEDRTDIDIYVKEMPRIPCSRLAFVRGLNKLTMEIAEGQLPNHSILACTTYWRKPNRHALAFSERTKDRRFTALDEYTPFHVHQDTLLHPMTVDRFDEYEYRAFLRFLVNSGELSGMGWGPLWHHSSDFERKLYKIEFMSDRVPQRVVEHYHQEFLWVLEYSRLRQKQSLTHASVSSNNTT